MNPFASSSTQAPPPDCLLLLALPAALEDELREWLGAQPEAAAGFTVLHGHGHGASVPLTTAMERVEGRARRVVIQLPLRHDGVAQLLARLRASLPSPQVHYWLLPVHEQGTLA